MRCFSGQMGCARALDVLDTCERRIAARRRKAFMSSPCCVVFVFVYWMDGWIGYLAQNGWVGIFVQWCK